MYVTCWMGVFSNRVTEYAIGIELIDGILGQSRWQESQYWPT